MKFTIIISVSLVSEFSLAETFGSGDVITEQMVALDAGTTDIITKDTIFQATIAQETVNPAYVNSKSDSNSVGVCEEFTCKQGGLCQINCRAAAGFYADSRDCRSYCQCTGHAKIPGLLNRCAPGTFWDQTILSCNHESLVDTGNCVQF